MSYVRHSQLSILHPNNATEYIIQCTTPIPIQYLILSLCINPIVHLGHSGETLVFLSPLKLLLHLQHEGNLLNHLGIPQDHLLNILYYKIIYKINTIFKHIKATRKTNQKPTEKAPWPKIRMRIALGNRAKYSRLAFAPINRAKPPTNSRKPEQKPENPKIAQNWES